MSFRFLLPLTLLTALTVSADPIACPTSAQTVSYFMGLAEGCTADGLVFSNFLYVDTPDHNPVPTPGLNPTDTDMMIEMTAFQGASWPGNPEEWAGLRIFYNDPDETLTLTDLNSTIHVHIEFDVTPINPAANVMGTYLFASLSTTENGNNAKVDENIKDESGGTQIAQMQATQGGNGPLIRYFSALGGVHVEKHFIMTTSNNVGSTTSLGPVYQGFLSTPEPGSWQLLSAGTLCMALGLLRMRRRSRK